MSVAEVETTPKAAPRGAPKWEADAKDRLRTGLRRFSKPMADLIDRDANEGDTRLLVTDFLCEALGYDKYSDLTTEYAVKGEFADYGVRIDQQLVAFIEVKRATTRLTTKHLRQVQNYAANEGVEWMVLTNGRIWQVYHLTGGLPLVVDKAFEVDILGDDTAAAKVADLFYLTRASMARRQIDALWQAKAATSGKSLASILVSDPVVDAIRKELRRQTGYNADPTVLAETLRTDVICKDLVPA